MEAVPKAFSAEATFAFNESAAAFSARAACFSIYSLKNARWFSGDIPKRDVYDEQTGRKTGTEPVMQRDEFNKFKLQVQKDFKKVSKCLTKIFSNQEYDAIQFAS